MSTTVIVPVYNAAADLAICLESLIDTLAPTTPVLVINDASPDPTVEQLFQRLQRRVWPSWQWLHNERNLGFVGTVNRGMGLTEGDVVLVNSDTQVTTGWLQRLEQCAASDPRIATITPLTNNGEIASWPQMCRDNGWPDDAERIARACVAAGPPLYPDMPTAVGFCMWIRRAALQQLGNFDEAAYGRGYGEENDFSQRARQHGWRNVLCDDAYVAHRGGASFGPLGLKPNGEALATVESRFPDYMDQVMAFIRSDPLQHRRARILAALDSV
ncbi:MAG: hypothetical protein Tsb002_02250 [Wenzhouxiangellaceae bacterium]